MLLFIMLFAIIFIFVFKFTKPVSKNNISNKELISYDNQLTKEQKIEDFNSLYLVLKENYPYFEVNKRVNNIDWLNNKEEYKKRIEKTKSDQEFYNVISSIIKDLHNNHTSIFNEDDYKYWFSLYSSVEQELKPWMDVLKAQNVLKRYKYSEMKNSTVGKSNLSNESNRINEYLKTDIIIPNKLAYLKVSSFYGLNVNKDQNIIYKFLYKVREYPNLIIDIRGNGGGAEEYWRKNIVAPLISNNISIDNLCLLRGNLYCYKFWKAKNLKLYNFIEINKELLKKSPTEVNEKFQYYTIFKQEVESTNYVGFKGKIYLLVDKKVFSSADSFANFCKSTKWATLVGEKTEGDGIGTDPVFYNLPNSGYVIRFAATYGLNADGSSNEEKKTEPDINVNAEIGRIYDEDKAIQKIITLIGREN